MVLLSAVFMIVVIPGVYHDTFPYKGAAIAILVAMALRLLVFLGFLNAIKKIKRDWKVKKRVYIPLGIVLLFLGLVYMDGAFAFLGHKDIFYVSILMFISVFCDFMAAITTFVSSFIRPKETN